MYKGKHILLKRRVNLVRKYNEYFNHNQSNTFDTNNLIYNSRTDPLELLIFNFNLTQITINTEHTDIPYDICLEECFKQRHLKILTITTNQSATESLHYLNKTNLDSLSFIHLTTNSITNHYEDHLKPILQNTRNLKTIIYENGYLDAYTMHLITKQKELKLLVLDNVMVQNYKSYSIMLFNLKVKTLIINLKHSFLNRTNE